MDGDDRAAVPHVKAGTRADVRPGSGESKAKLNFFFPFERSTSPNLGALIRKLNS